MTHEITRTRFQPFLHRKNEHFRQPWPTSCAATRASYSTYSTSPTGAAAATIEPITGKQLQTPFHCKICLPVRHSRPQLAVEGAILNGFGDVFRCEPLRPRQIGNGAGHFQNAIVGAGAELQLVHRHLEEFQRRFVERAEGL